MNEQFRQGVPIAYLTTTKPLNTLQFQCFYCKKMMTKKAIINDDTFALNLELKCPDHEAVDIVVII